MDQSGRDNENEPLLDHDTTVDVEMESESHSEDDTELAMQQMMGFSTFNTTQRPAGKREYGREKRSAGGAFGTGANSQPVASRMPSASQAKSTILSNPPSEQNDSSIALPPTTGNHQLLPSSLPPKPPRQPENNQSVPIVGSSITLEPTESNHNQSSLDADPHTNHKHHSRLSHHSHTTDPNAIAYTNPTTGVSFTKSELDSYRAGKQELILNNKGEQEVVKVYFQPDFVEDDIWGELERGEVELVTPSTIR